MANTITIARPYAKAAFSAAKSANQLALWSQALRQLSLAVQDAGMKSAMKDPSRTKNQLSDLLISFLHQANSKGSTVNNLTDINNFIKLLSDKKRLAVLPDVATLFEEDLAKESQYLSVVVTSAFPMDDHQRAETKEKLSKQLNSDLVIEFAVDANLIGGLVVRSGNWVMDGSVKSKLTRLKAALS